MKTLLWFAATWIAPFVASIVAVGFGAAVAGKGMSAGETAVMLLIPLQLLFFLAGTIVLWRVSAGVTYRAALVAAHAALQLGTVVTLAFVTMLAFNR